MDEINLTDVLAECQICAKKGYDIARQQLSKTEKILDNAKVEIQNTLDKFNNSPCYFSDSTDDLQKQLVEIQKSFDKFGTEIKNDVKAKKKNLADFSITLFGRTMAGKSTLMEILTHGNGKSIGQGSQRTTKDVRTYEWNNLKITDVPGIGAFEGQQDESIAFESAKSGDLILFLMTDDAPQPKEAECFGRIIALGKPVICIINARAKLDGSSHKMKIRDIKNALDRERLDLIKKQFLDYSKILGQKWGYVPFVYTHLNAAYESQHIEDEVMSKELYRISQMDYLKKKIVDQICMHGKLYRIKSFVDLISVPLLKSIGALLEQSDSNSIQGRTIKNKKEKLEEWKDKFYPTSIKKIESFTKTIKSDLKSEVATFAEYHFDDENADKAWDKVLKEKRIEDRAKDVLADLDEQCINKIQEISREIKSELKFAFSNTNDSHIKMPKIRDLRKFTEWATTILGGGLGVGSAISLLAGAATIAGPLGWAALAVTGIGLFLSWLFGSRTSKEMKARRELEEKLSENIDKICENLNKAMTKSLKDLVNKRLISMCHELQKMVTVLFGLSNTQKVLAWQLNKGLLATNKALINESIILIGANGMQYHVDSVARIPGISILICLNPNTRFPDDVTQALTSSIGEKIHFVIYNENKRTLIAKILKDLVPYENISIENKIGVAHISVESITPELTNRVKLAQQLSELLITKN